MPIFEPPSNQIVQVGPGGPDPMPGNALKPIFGADRNNPFSYVVPQNITEGNPYYEGNMPSQGEIYEELGLPDPAEEKTDTSFTPTQSASDNAETGGFSMSELIAAHPDWTPEQVLSEAAKYSDEYAELWNNYRLEQGQLDRANEYTAGREDTAYQRLVKDLKAAGLNPAMMYGSTASTSASGSQGYVKMTEGANSRQIKNLSIVRDIILKWMEYDYKSATAMANSIGKVLGAVLPW